MAKFFQKYHKWVGLVLTIFILMFAVSGVLLNHRRLIAPFDLPRAWLPVHYHYSNWNNGAASGTVRLGDTALLLDSLIGSVGDFMVQFPQLTLETYAYNRPEEWLNGWTLFFWAWWITWGAFVGMFLARISRGRTFREFIFGALILPFSYVVMWVAIFGNSALELIRSGDTDFAYSNTLALEDGQSLKGDGWQCQRTGDSITCENADKHGFTIGSKAQKLF